MNTATLRWNLVRTFAASLVAATIGSASGYAQGNTIRIGLLVPLSG